MVLTSAIVATRRLKENNMNEIKQTKKPSHSSNWYTIFFAAFAGAMLILDFASKWIVQALCLPGTHYQIIPNFLYVSLSYNTKIAFSLGFDGVGGRVLNIIVSVIMSVAIIAYYIVDREKLKPFMKATLALLAAGAVGNLVDRAFYWSGTTGFDGVIDFIQFYLGGGPGASSNAVNPFATFNWADSCLSIGVVLFIIYLVYDWIKHPNDDNSKDPRVKESTAESNPTRNNGVTAKKEDDKVAKTKTEEKIGDTDEIHRR